ncbi:MAG: TIGR01777 family protein [Saprospiraceae bacterium]|nr:TIGR01777 family protein [Saprospiraceae bacterium]
MSRTILIAGGTGLIGTSLKNYLSPAGHQVRILSRKSSHTEASDTFHWNPSKNSLDPESLKNIDVIINLTGASIASGHWTKGRKKVLRASRVDTTRFLLEKCLEHGVKCQAYIGSSAVGIYGNRQDQILTEHSEIGAPGFLVNLCQEWEAAHDAFEQVADRVIKLRTGIVLSNYGGAWPQLKRSVIFGIGAYLGSGQQYMPWIHMQDQIRIIEGLIQNETITGVVNASAPNPVTNRQFVASIVQNQGGLGWLLPVPAFLLRLALGQMSSVLLDGQRVIPQQLTNDGFIFSYSEIDEAIANLVEKKAW